MSTFRSGRARGLRAAALTLALAWLAGHGQAHAEAEFRLTTGAGFDDDTPVAPIGGNPGTTLGAQRRELMLHALRIWGGVLESKVPIVVDAEFDLLECSRGGAIVGGAAATGWVRPRPPADLPPGQPPVIYPVALGDRLAERDIAPGTADIYIVINANLDIEPCKTAIGGLYYGFDGAGGSTAIDLLSTALHELAHGLGFASSVDEVTGKLTVSLGIDAFSTHIRDLDLDRTWERLSDLERAGSTGNVRRLVFDGPATTEAAKRQLERGEPQLILSPKVAGVTGYLADVGFAINPANAPVTGKLMIASPVDACAELTTSVQGAIVVVEPNSTKCPGRASLNRLVEGGAAGILLVAPSPVDLPALPIAAGAEEIRLPIATLAIDDAIAIARELPKRAITARLGGDPNRSAGADERGRPYLFASSPHLRGTSISHFDPLTRPDLLMEPYTSDTPTHDLDLTVAVMRDLGWISACGNGVVEPSEECDLGTANIDASDARCRTNCRRPVCGDAVIDSGEECDEGLDNSDKRPNACRKNCKVASCGDLVLDRGEQCDGKVGCGATCRSSVQDAGVPAAPDAAVEELDPTAVVPSLLER
ncbi:MAG: hypothetical protein ABW252_23135 [Polyangiales bacterium]